MEKSNILKKSLQKGFLLDKEILDIFILLDESAVDTLINRILAIDSKEKVINKKILKNNSHVFKDYLENISLKIFFEKIGIKKIILQKDDSSEDQVKVKILHAPTIIPKKISVPDFVNYFRARYEQLKKYLQTQKLDNLKSLRRITNSRENCTIIVSILNKTITKNNNIILDVEDLSGAGKVLISKNKKEVFEKGSEVLVDDIIAMNVSGNDEILFANDIIYPDLLLDEKRKQNKEEIIAVTSDLHVGSNMFLEKNFLKFIKWLNGEEGTPEQKKLANKIKYLFIVGDSVDGVGVFPGQEKLLNIMDMKSQYNKLVEMLKLIRKDIKIIICPGQHDAVWVGEPQLSIDEEFSGDLSKMENVTLVPNPSLIEINGGFKVLMYHGASMHGFVENISRIRLGSGHDSPTTIVKELLKRRHLSPMHGVCDYIPTTDKDNLVIDFNPDIVLTGDLHRSEVSYYNNVLLMTGGCWQSQTPFEEKVGNNPDPGKVNLFNLKTREVKVMDFMGGEDENRD